MPREKADYRDRVKASRHYRICGESAQRYQTLGCGKGNVEEDMDLTTLIIQLISGALGGNVAGSLFKNLSLGTLGNSLAGIVGGGLGGQVLGSLLNLPPAAGAAGLDPMAILTQLASGGVGGGVLMAVIGLLRSMMSK
jgi:uncharacterized membrane protein YeaQ/YmgE (transglycosylase-associated protein family)